MFLRILTAAIVTFSAFGASGETYFRPYGEGLPLPWPFPWAKECPVICSSLSGRYLMLDTQSPQEMELKVSIVTERGLRFVRISRYNAQGAMVSDGFTFLTRDQRSVSVYMHSLNKDQVPLWANVKFYHTSNRLSCDLSTLVPILSLIDTQTGRPVETQYRLVRRPHE